MKVWKKLRFLFDTDDGSLPEVRVTELSSGGLAAVVDFIRSRAAVNADTPFWHRALDREERLDAYSNAATLVAQGQADPFHFLASRLSFHGVVLPDLGVFVFPDEVALDYRMGNEWGEPQVLALFELLRRLAALDTGARVRLDRHVSARVERLFLDAWSEYCREATPS
jgi:hypothetical protein